MLIKTISNLVEEAIKKAFPELIGLENRVVVTVATQEKFGHYQCNNALKMAKMLKKSPIDVAKAIIEHIDHDGVFAKIEIAGAGFINFTLSKYFLGKSAQLMLERPKFGIAPPQNKERVLVEFSSPNIAKEMHVGHLRSTIIGECIARLFEFLGYDVLRINHVGDYGTQFGMLIAYMQEEAQDVLQGRFQADLSTLMHWYRESKKRFDADNAFKTKARTLVVALQQGQSDVVAAWNTICAISRKGFEEVYRLLDVRLDERGESFYSPYLAPVVEDLEKKGLITLSECAKCVFIEGIEVPLMVQKSDGGYNYDTTDIAALKYRVEEDRAQRIIVITDSGQALHFQLVYKTALKAGYIDPKKTRFDHVTFGLVLGSDGKKFRTRSGETEKLIDLLFAAVKESKNLLEKREHSLDSDEVDKLSQILGIGAVKYADLSCNRIGDYLFSYERMLKFEGNTATAILYSYVRVSGIKRKMPECDIAALIKTKKIAVEHPVEVDLAFQLLRFEETLRALQEDLFPHYLTDYLYTLSSKFNAFFRDCQVIGSKEQDSRLLVAELTAQVMREGLHLLGLKTVEKM